MRFEKSFFVFVALLISLLSLVSASSFVTNPGYSNYQRSGGSFFSTSYQSPADFDRSMCREGQDFILNINPLKCSPSVVRSDLLEENDVPIFCEIDALKINPLIDVNLVRDIDFRGDWSSDIKSIGFHSTYSALGPNQKLNNLETDSVGNVVIVLRRNPNESSMPDFVEANLTARLRYDLNNAFGVRYSNFYLPVMSDSEFEEYEGNYPFLDKRGFLRADAINENTARISVYSDFYESPFGKSREGEIEKQRIGFYDLNKGESTPTLYLPGYDCYAGVKIKLLDIKNPDTTAKFLVGSEMIEVRDNEEFLEGKCRILSLNDLGVSDSVRISCKQDFNSQPFDLFRSQSVKLEINKQVEEHSLGDYLFSFETEDGTEHAYLGVINSQPTSAGLEKDLQVHIVSTKEKAARLSDDELSIVNDFARSHSQGGEGLIDKAVNVMNFLTTSAKTIITGTKYKVLTSEGEVAELGDYKVRLLGLAEPQAVTLKSDVRNYFDNANEDFDTVINNYPEEEYSIKNVLERLSVKAYHDKITLAAELLQNRMALELCEQFEENYPNYPSPNVCQDKGALYGDSKNSAVVFINGEPIPIVFKGVFTPSLEDYSAVVSIRKKNQEIIASPTLTKDKIVYINGSYHEGDYIKLGDLKENSADITISYLDELSRDGRKTETHTLRLNDPESFGTDYVFRLEKVNLNKVAHVQVDTKVDAAGSVANFSVKIGIEKRLIQLSPEKTQQRIESLNNTINTFNGITEKIKVLESGMKLTCLATGGYLTLKNLITGMGGEAIARSEVMTGAGGWNERCKTSLNEKDAQGNPVYASFEDCLFQHSKDINADVQELQDAMNEQNEEFKKIYQDPEILSKGTLEDQIIDKTKLAEKYSINVRNSLEEIPENGLIKDGALINPQDSTKSLNLDSLKGVLDKQGFEEGMYDIEDAKEIELYAKLLKEDPSNEAYRQRLYNSLDALSSVSKKYTERTNLASEAGILADQIGYVLVKGYDDQGRKISNTLQYKGLSYSDFNRFSSTSSKARNPIQPIQTSDGGYYYVELDDSAGTERLTIKRENVELENGKTETRLVVWDRNWNRIPQDEIPPEFESLDFFKQDDVTYNNPLNPKEAVVRYYETEPYKGLPSVIPFDKDEGWYVYVDQPALGLKMRESYSDSGRIERFYICNAGSNGLIDIPPSNGLDNCASIDLGIRQTYEAFLGLDQSKSSKVLKDAVQAIYDAMRGHDDGIRNVNILGSSFAVGSPVYQAEGYQCTDYMSPKDCQLLFNVCDPVICPSSRCDFGGKYPVRDVIQSGVIGSIALCLPNYQEGIYVPICVSGVRAGMEGFGSVLESYRDCLQKSLETGETVGICDEIHSIYVCEFFWRQAVPLVKFGVPKLLSSIKGENIRGGGEYLGVTSAWENAKASIDYFTDYYAVNSYKAFKARSTEQVGGQFCKVFGAISYPQGQGILDLLLEPDSPHQFNGHFDEIKLTSQTNPPFSHYKVYFHIYAGDDRSAYYRIYLRGGSSSYYQDTILGREVDSGYIPRGQYVSETMDITAPSGFTELCIRVNDQEECGFGRAGTSFAYNYMADQYIQRQANTTNITTEAECISGSSDLYSLTNLNVQEGLGNLANPEIYNKGVVRVCSTTNPGEGVASDQAGTINSRWKDVGHCGDKNLRCWIDTESLADAFKWDSSYKEVQESLTENYLDQLIKAEQGFTHEQFKEYIEKILDEDLDLDKKIEMINKNISQVIYPEEKAYLYYLRGSYYAKLAIENFEAPVSEKEEDVEEELREDTLEYFNKPNFVSPILRMKVSGLFNPDICYQYSAKEGWKWSNDCDDAERGYYLSNPMYNVPGSIDYESLRFSWYNINDLTSEKIDEDNEAIYRALSQRNSYESGIKLLLEQITRNDVKMQVETSSGKVEVTSDGRNRIFELDIFEHPLYMFYGNLVGITGDDKWYWSLISKNSEKEGLWVSGLDKNVQKVYKSTWNLFWENLLTPREFGKSLGRIWSDDPDNEDLKSATISDEQKRFFELIKEKTDNEAQGAMIMFSYEDYLKYQTSVSVEPSTKAQLYKSLIEEYSFDWDYPISPSLVAAVIKQESNFISYAVSPTGCVGLMGFYSGAAYDYGLCDKKDCSGTDYRKDAEKSIEAGSNYLRDLLKRYDSYEDKTEFALAAYNGGMGVVDKAIDEVEDKNDEVNWENVEKEITSELLSEFSVYRGEGWDIVALEMKVSQIKDYVTDVLEYEKQYRGLFESGVEGEQKLPVLEKDLIDSQKRVLNEVNLLEGMGRGDISDEDSSGDVSCFDSVLYVYDRAGVDKRCVYTDGNLGSYNLLSSQGVVAIDTSSVKGNKYFCTSETSSSCEYKSLGEYSKLNLLRPGYFVSYVSEFSYAPHNAIFIGWKDKSTYYAELFDWNGDKNSNGETTWRTYYLDISDDSHPIYQIWKPYLKGEETVSDETGLSENEQEDIEVTTEIWARVVDTQSALDYLNENDLLGAPDSLLEKKEFIATVFRKEILVETEDLDESSQIENIKEALERKIIEEDSDWEDIINARTALEVLEVKIREGLISLDDKYNNNYAVEVFVEKVKGLGNVLTIEEYKDITGEGGWFFNTPDKVSEIKSLLEKKASLEEAMSEELSEEEFYSRLHTTENELLEFEFSGLEVSQDNLRHEIPLKIETISGDVDYVSLCPVSPEEWSCMSLEEKYPGIFEAMAETGEKIILEIEENSIAKQSEPLVVGFFSEAVSSSEGTLTIEEALELKEIRIREAISGIPAQDIEVYITLPDNTRVVGVTDERGVIDIEQLK
jgi:hypothetical protein